MICPDRCTMELIGTYRGIKINQIYRCKWCTVTSYRSVEMDKEQLIAEMAVENAELREQIRAKDAELDKLNGVFAEAGVCEPVEGFAKRPQDLKHCVFELVSQLARWKGIANTHDYNEQRLAAELERVRELLRGWIAWRARVHCHLREGVRLEDAPLLLPDGESIAKETHAALASPEGEADQPAPATEPVRQETLYRCKCCGHLYDGLVSSCDASPAANAPFEYDLWVAQPAPATEPPLRWPGCIYTHTASGTGGFVLTVALRSLAELHDAHRFIVHHDQLVKAPVAQSQEGE